MTLAELTKLQRSKDLVAQIPEMHAEYQRVTRLNAPYRINYEYPWSLWLSEGWGKKGTWTGRSAYQKTDEARPSLRRITDVQESHLRSRQVCRRPVDCHR
jgi:hypothetical protein